MKVDFGAITISILALFTKKGDNDMPFFLIVDKLKRYINQHQFRILFITPDPIYPDPKRALYDMFGNSLDESNGLEIVQMNVV